jgi:glycosyltransferase involved in cell wall biosynthesis
VRTALFTGRVYTSAIPDIALAIDAVAAARRRGIDVRLVQTGAIEPGFDLAEYAAGRGLERGAFLSLGRLAYPDVLATLRAADVLLQPGPPSRFNRLRLPSKLQSYLGSGTPTITFGVGFGELLEAGTEALTTQTGDAGELADRLVEILTDGSLRERLRAGGPVAAARLFDPDRNTQALLDHYEACLGGPR